VIAVEEKCEDRQCQQGKVHGPGRKKAGRQKGVWRH
jgi:hypothetical protein